jgi:hypothetical protein
MLLHVHFLQLPDLALAQAKAGLVFEEEDVVLGWPIGRSFLANRHDRSLGIWREKGANVQNGAERNISEIGRRAVLAYQTVRKHREGMRRVAEELTRGFHTEAAAAISVVDECEHSTARA